jgi:hypothetical protein
MSEGQPVQNGKSRMALEAGIRDEVRALLILRVSQPARENLSGPSKAIARA